MKTFVFAAFTALAICGKYAYGASQELSGLAPCEKTKDIVIVIDSTRDVAEDYYYMKDFAARVAAFWFGWSSSRVAFYVFSDNTDLVLGLDSELTIEERIQLIERAPHHDKASRRSDLALYGAWQHLFMSNSTTTGIQSMVFVTAGGTVPVEFRQYTYNEAYKLHAAGVHCFGVGVGNNSDYKDELRTIASDPSYVFAINEFYDLKDALTSLIMSPC